MIEHDFCIRKSASEIGELADLWMKQPRIETQAEPRKTGKALAKGRIEQEAFRTSGVHVGDVRVRIPGGRVPDASEAAVAGRDFRLQHRSRAFAEQQIGMADDTGADRGGTIATARAHRRGAVSEFDLPHPAQRLLPAGAVPPACL